MEGVLRVGRRMAACREGSLRSVFFVPVFEQRRELPGVLEALERAGPACDEVLLVDNGSRDGSGELVRASGHPYLVIEENVGVGHAMN